MSLLLFTRIRERYSFIIILLPRKRVTAGENASNPKTTFNIYLLPPRFFRVFCSFACFVHVQTILYCIFIYPFRVCHTSVYTRSRERARACINNTYWTDHLGRLPACSFNVCYNTNITPIPTHWNWFMVSRVSPYLRVHCTFIPLRVHNANNKIGYSIHKSSKTEISGELKKKEPGEKDLGIDAQKKNSHSRYTHI